MVGSARGGGVARRGRPGRVGASSWPGQWSALPGGVSRSSEPQGRHYWADGGPRRWRCRGRAGAWGAGTAAAPDAPMLGAGPGVKSVGWSQGRRRQRPGGGGVCVGVGIRVGADGGRRIPDGGVARAAKAKADAGAEQRQRQRQQQNRPGLPSAQRPAQPPAQPRHLHSIFHIAISVPAWRRFQFRRHSTPPPAAGCARCSKSRRPRRCFLHCRFRTAPNIAGRTDRRGPAVPGGIPVLRCGPGQPQR